MLSHKNKVDISVILTGYNEGSCVLSNLFKIKDLLTHSRYTWEIILYDDKSSDNTLNYFKEFAKNNRNIKVFAHQKNTGRGRTIKDAVNESSGEIVGYIDTDLELSPVYIFEFVKEIINGADVVIGVRFYTVGASNLIRAILSKGYIFLMHILLKLPFKDTETGFKFFNKINILPILKKVKDERWFFDTEIVARSYWAGLKIAEVPVVYMRNENKLSSVRPIADSIDYLRKILAFRKITKKKR